jgi:hypothetical protein
MRMGRSSFLHAIEETIGGGEKILNWGLDLMCTVVNGWCGYAWFEKREYFPCIIIVRPYGRAGAKSYDLIVT